jgi:lipid-binding SYLF domain-containing protein
VRAWLGLVFACTLGVSARAWEPRPDSKLERRAARAIEAIHKRMPKTRPYFEQAYAYAVFPSVTRIGFGVGGAGGKGIVVVGDHVVGRARFWQFTTGIQAGGKAFRMILFFKDEEALEYFERNQLEFMGQAGVAFAHRGANANPGYNSGVAIFTLTQGGLMAEATVAGGWFRYRPVEAGPD